MPREERARIVRAQYAAKMHAGNND